MKRWERVARFLRIGAGTMATAAAAGLATAPDFRGKWVVAGILMWLAGWADGKTRHWPRDPWTPAEFEAHNAKQGRRRSPTRPNPLLFWPLP